MIGRSKKSRWPPDGVTCHPSQYLVLYHNLRGGRESICVVRLAGHLVVRQKARILGRSGIPVLRLEPRRDAWRVNWWQKGIWRSPARHDISRASSAKRIQTLMRRRHCWTNILVFCAREMALCWYIDSVPALDSGHLVTRRIAGNVSLWKQ
jgi:hypothetical protein